MNKYLGFLVCLAVFVVAASAADLKCYSCQAEASKCKTDSDSRKPHPCTKPLDSKFQSVCIYKLTHDKTKNTDQVYAECGQIPVGSPLNKDSAPECKETGPNAANIEVKECNVCNTDLCNSAPISSRSLLTLLCLPVMYLFTKYALY